MNPLLPKTILVADDHPHILKLVEFSLEEIDCWIESVHTGEEAVAKAAQMDIDLLIIDIKLPGIDGFEAIRQIKSDPKRSNLPVIVLTGQGQRELGGVADGLGVTAFFIKPFSPIQLANQARKSLNLSN
ncbi:MAG TPA: response regulator [Chthoniobacteraceae bacterium]|nr:response regulator [Chthoniobacteraceae bacterium]